MKAKGALAHVVVTQTEGGRAGGVDGAIDRLNSGKARLRSRWDGGGLMALQGRHGGGGEARG